jgi:ferredoxin
MMTIIIELLSFLLLSRAVYSGIISEDCKVSTTNTNNYMCPDLSGVFDISVADLGCGQTNYEPGSSSSQVSTVVSCSDVSAGYVIDCIVYASLGMVAGSCSQFYTGFEEPNPNHITPSWCETENNVCCFGDDTFSIHVHEEIGAQCRGKSTCDIAVDETGFSINGGQVSEFSDSDKATLDMIKGHWGLKVLFQCAPADTIEDSVEESEYTRYEFELNDDELNGIPDLDIKIIGYCANVGDGDGHIDRTEPEGDIFNDCVYSKFRFEVYSGDDLLDDTRWWQVAKNAPNCGEYEGSLPVDIDGIYYNIGFSVNKIGGDC